MSRGFLISFEGVEGSGKTTQVDLLHTALQAAGRRTVVCREPGGTALGEAIRSLLLDVRDRPPAPLTELLLLEASRAQLVDEVIRPALERGSVVICDRFSDASLAYQWGARGIDRGLVERLNELATGGTAPLRTILLDLDPSQGRQRRGRAGLASDRVEREEAAFHEKVRQTYLLLAREAPNRFLVVDARLEPGRLAARIRQALEPLLGPLPEVDPAPRSPGRPDDPGDARSRGTAHAS